MTQKQFELLRFVAQMLLDNKGHFIREGGSTGQDFDDLAELFSVNEGEAFNQGLDLTDIS